MFSVGIPSESFGFNQNYEFYLIPGISIEGITPDTLKTYCTDFMLCGTCYKALNKIRSSIQETGHYKFQGFIFWVRHYLYINL